MIDDSEGLTTLNFRPEEDLSDDEDFMEVEDESEVEEEGEDDEIQIYKATILSCIEEGSYVVIRAPPGSLDFFFIMKISEKGIATENMSDFGNEHSVLKGESYLIGRWYSLQYEKKCFVQYKEAKTQKMP